VFICRIFQNKWVYEINSNIYIAYRRIAPKWGDIPFWEACASVNQWFGAPHDGVRICLLQASWGFKKTFNLKTKVLGVADHSRRAQAAPKNNNN